MLQNMEAEPRRNIILIISGPAGSGKTTLCDHLTAKYPEKIERVVTTTTRPPRPGELDGVDYHFLSREEFEARRRGDGFYEWAEVHGNVYGTEKARVRAALEGDRDLLLNIDVQGADSFRRAAASDASLQGRVVTIFVRPQSLTQLQDRLLARGSENPASLERRLQTAAREIPEAEKFHHVIVSGSRAADSAALEAIYKKHTG